MTMYQPHEIGLVADYEGHDNYDENPEGWVAHYPGIDRLYLGELDDSFKALRGIEKYAMSKDWWGIPYDYGVDLAGVRFLLRGTGRSGATSGDYDEDGIPNNSESDAILLIIGNDQDVTREMMDGVQDLVDDLGGSREYFIGHKQAKGIVTSCPGSSVMEYIVKPLSEGKNLRDVAAPGSVTDPKPAPEPHPVEPDVDWRTEIYEDMELINLRGVTDDSSTWKHGPAVRVLQGLQVANGVAPANTIRDDGTLDGIAGPGTKDALYALQRKLRVPDDGVAGPVTYEAALRGLGTVDGSDVTSDYRTWVRGIAVEIVQASLVANGVAPANTINEYGEVDGVFGPGTRAATEDFQFGAGLFVDAIVGPKTYRALLVK